MEYIKKYIFNNKEKIDAIREFMEKKESHILNSFPYVSSYNINIDRDSVTTRAGSYNVFSLSDECEELYDLFDFLKASYIDYIESTLPNKTFDLKDLNPAVSCWLNILRKGENVGLHKHSEYHGDLWSMVSGVFILSSNGTKTTYSHNKEEFFLENNAGELIIFPPYYNHESSENKTEQKRVTLGMDFLFKKEHAPLGSNFYKNLIEI